MQQVQTASSTTPAAGPGQTVRAFFRHWLAGRRGLIIAGLAVIAAGLALGWNWLTAIGVAPIILGLAPCAAMCAVGACAMMKGASATKSGAPDQAKPMDTTVPIRSDGPARD